MKILKYLFYKLFGIKKTYRERNLFILEASIALEDDYEINDDKFE